MWAQVVCGVAPLLLVACAGSEQGILFEGGAEGLASHGAPTDLRLPYGSGAAFLDCDNDGVLEIMVTSRVGANSLLRRVGQGYEDFAAAAGVDDPDGDSAGIAVADYDNDGDRDVFVGRNGANRLFRNRGDCTFDEVAATAGVAGVGFTQSAAWGDVDGDGWLDLYYTNHTAVSLPPPADEPDRRDVLLRNRGDGSFEEVQGLPAADGAGTGFAAVFSDLDGDGDVDLYVLNDAFDTSIGNRFYENVPPVGADVFEFVARSTNGLALEENAMGVAVADYDNDGDLDVAFSNIGQAPLLRNNGAGLFEDVTDIAGVAHDSFSDEAFVSWGMTFADFDNDGLQDLFIAGGGLHGFTRYAEQPNLLFRNLGDGTFEDVTAGSGAEQPLRAGRSVARGDANGDGFPDLVVVSYGRDATLLTATPNQHNWLVVDLQGTVSNRDGIGARIIVTTDAGARLTREIRSGGSLGAGHDLAGYFGLAGAQVQSLEVRWPSGVSQQVTGVSANQRLLVVEQSD